LADSGPNFETEPSQRKLTRVARLVLLGVRIATASLQMRAIIPWFGGGGGGIPDRGNHGRFRRLPGGGGTGETGLWRAAQKVLVFYDARFAGISEESENFDARKGSRTPRRRLENRPFQRVS
jgi:hypothetical protein